MASSSNEGTSAYFRFIHDISSFKDFVSMVIVCAPNRFMPMNWRGPDDQMNLDRAFAGLRYGLKVTASKLKRHNLLDECGTLVEEAYIEYSEGRDDSGREKLLEMEGLLKKL